MNSAQWFAAGFLSGAFLGGWFILNMVRIVLREARRRGYITLPEGAGPKSKGNL